jgi:hypothetical protein
MRDHHFGSSTLSCPEQSRLPADFNLAKYENGVRSPEYVNAPPGITFPGDAGFNGKSDTLNHVSYFAPRVGMVWDPTGTGKMTIRAGYGLSYNTSVMWNTMHVVLNPPWGVTPRAFQTAAQKCTMVRYSRLNIWMDSPDLPRPNTGTKPFGTRADSARISILANGAPLFRPQGYRILWC